MRVGCDISVGIRFWTLKSVTRRRDGRHCFAALMSGTAVMDTDALLSALAEFQGCALPEFPGSRLWLAFRECRYRGSPDSRACNRCRDCCLVAEAQTAAAAQWAAQPPDVSRRREWPSQPRLVAKTVDVAAPRRPVSLHQEKSREC